MKYKLKAYLSEPVHLPDKMLRNKYGAQEEAHAQVLYVKRKNELYEAWLLKNAHGKTVSDIACYLNRTERCISQMIEERERHVQENENWRRKVFLPLRDPSAIWQENVGQMLNCFQEVFAQEA